MDARMWRGLSANERILPSALFTVKHGGGQLREGMHLAASGSPGLVFRDVSSTRKTLLPLFAVDIMKADSYFYTQLKSQTNFDRRLYHPPGVQGG
jgi:hypothetical protein